MGVASAGLTIVQMHTGPLGWGAHNLTAFGRSMTATVGLTKISNNRKNVRSMYDLNFKSLKLPLL